VLSRHIEKSAANLAKNERARPLRRTLSAGCALGMRYAHDVSRTMIFRFLAPRALALVGASAVLIAARQASAAPTVTIQPTAITRTPAATHTDSTTLYWFSRADCLANQVVHFPLIIADFLATPQLEVWIGEGSVDCRDRVARTPGTSLSCWEVYSAPQYTTGPTIDIRVQDIASKHFGDARGAGTADSCNDTSGITGARDVTFYFMFIQSLDNQGSASWPTKIDLVGPNPPTGLTLGIGNTILKPSWSANPDTDVTGYHFFCDPPPGSAPTTFQMFEGGTSTATAGSAGAGGAGGSVAEAGTDDAATDGVATDDATGSGGTGNDGGSVGSSCTSVNFTSGVAPTPDFVTKFQCGDDAGAKTTSGLISGISNGVFTNVAAASFDLVGNVGPLSTVVCAAPQQVIGFDEVYHNAGGTAGGGFCSITYRRGGHAGAWLAASLVALGLAVRRRTARRTDNAF